MSNTVKKIVFEEHVAHITEKHALYFHSAHTSNTYHLYERTDINDPESKIEHLLSMDDNGLKALAQVLDLSFSKNNDESGDEIEDWEWFAIRYFHVGPNGISKKEAIELMKKE